MTGQHPLRTDNQGSDKLTGGLSICGQMVLENLPVGTGKRSWGWAVWVGDPGMTEVKFPAHRMGFTIEIQLEK